MVDVFANLNVVRVVMGLNGDSGMSDLSWLRDWWAHILAVLGFASSEAVAHYRLRQLEKDKEKFVTKESCESFREPIKIQFSHGQEQFEEIKKMIADNAKNSEDRHNCLIKILLKEDRK